MSGSFISALVGSSRFGAALGDFALKGFVLLAAAVAFASICRRRSAATRHVIWSATTAGLLLLPLATLLLPHWTVPLPARWLASRPNMHGHDVAQARTAAASEEGVVDAVPTAADLPSPAARVVGGGTHEHGELPAAATAAAMDGFEWIGAVWLLGIIVAMVPTMAGWTSLIRLQRRGRMLTDDPVAAMLADLVARFGLRRRITACECADRPLPMTWGFWRPIIALPTDAANWPRERLHAVLLHELAHVARCDCVTQWLAQWARALHWFNPLAWYAVAALRVEQEQACDDCVLSAGHGAADYAEQLLSVTSGRMSPRWSASFAPAMARPRGLERRLRTILDPSRNRKAPSRRQVAGVLVCGFALLATLAMANLELSGDEPRAKVQSDDRNAKAGEGASPEAELNRLRDARAKVLEHYFKELDAGKMTEGAIQGMLAALDDPYSEYFSPRQLADFNKRSGGKLVGIGAMLAMDPDDADATKDEATERKVMVVTPLEGSPALKAGLEAGDEILAVDGKTIAGLDLHQVIALMVGDERSVLTLKLRRSGNEIELAITRGQVNLPAVEGLRRGADGHWDFWLDREHKIAYMRIVQFAPATAGAISGALGDATKHGMQGVVLDLRQCPGGELSAAVDVAKLFIADGVIVSVKSRGEAAQEAKADGKAPFAETPVVALIDDQTASASEVLAGALRERKGTLLVGVRTFGKGSVQSIVTLGDDEGALKLTTGFFQSPGGRDIDRAAGGETWGVDPSEGCYVPLEEDQSRAMSKLRLQRGAIRKSSSPAVLEDLTPKAVREQMADPQLAAGLKTMLAKLATGQFDAAGEALPPALTEGRREQLDADRRAIMAELRRLERELKLIDKAYDPKKVQRLEERLPLKK
jgi:carboxyl-terminal processing protease